MPWQPRQKTSTTRLPRALREELGIVLDDTAGKTFPRRNTFQNNGRNNHDTAKSKPSWRLTRKETRKNERVDRKQQKSVTAPGGGQPKPYSAHEKGKRPIPPSSSISDFPGRPSPAKKARPNPPDAKKQRRVSFAAAADTPESLPPTKPKKKETPLERLVAQQEKTATALSSSSKVAALKVPLDRRERDEDDEIAWLEANLGMKKGKKRKAATEDDGLDDLLDDLDRVVYETRESIASRNAPTESDDDEQESESEVTQESDSDSTSDVEEIESTADDEKELGFSDMESDVPDDEDEDSVDEARPSRAEAAPVLTSRYVPPALRNTTATGSSTAVKSDAQVKLIRQLKGHLNKLSEQNIGSILEEIEVLYRDNSRNDVTTCLTDLIIQSISSHSSLLDTFVILHATLVACLHKVIGVEFTAYFVQSLVSAYEGHYATAVTAADEEAELDDDIPIAPEGGKALVKGKAASNLLVLLAELYTFQVVSCVLIYDIIRSFLSSRLGELEVELFLKLLKSIGVQLRQDDPTALKDIIILVQTQTSQQDKSTQSSRTRFMLETLSNLKNNKIMDRKGRVGQQNVHVAADAVDKMKRFIKAMERSRTVRGTEPLNVSLEDLRNADKKGKWWLVGSAWAGDPLVDAAAKHDAETMVLDDDDSGLRTPARSDALLKLAKRQGMNTEVRRSIFVVLMSSEDYVDACERLTHIKITDQQRPEVIRVLLHCLGNEKVYNPYYTLVAQHLSSNGSNRHVRFSLQYCLWDLFREFGEDVSAGDAGGGVRSEKVVAATRVRNMARAYAWWVAKGAVTLEIFKVLDFLTLQEQTASFLRMFFAQLLVSSQSASPMLDYATTSEAEAETLSRDRQIVELVMVKAIKQANVVQGTIRFFGEERDALAGQARLEVVEKLIRWGMKVARETLGAGAEVSSIL